MFGLLVSGRPVLGPPETISPTQFAFTIPSTPQFSHLAIFLLPGTNFPAEDVGATVWFSTGGDFRFLGALSPVKPSAIFKLSESAVAPSAAAVGAAVDTDGMQVRGAGQVVIGISIERAAQVEEQVARAARERAAGSSTAVVRAGDKAASTPGVLTTKLLAQRIIGNAFNFLSSFNGDTVPLKAFRDWWDKFETKVSLDPGFLEREQD